LVLPRKFKTEAQNSSFAQKLLQLMISREKFILNNKVFVSAIFLDPRYKITLNEAQCLISIGRTFNKNLDSVTKIAVMIMIQT